MENKESIRNSSSGLGLLERLYAEEAFRLLGNQLSEIRYISDWARLAGYSRGRLCRLIKQHYKLTPSELLVRIRFERIATILREDPEVTSYHVGRQVGLTDEQGVYKFLSRWYGTTFTELRRTILIEHLEAAGSNGNSGVNRLD